MRLVSSNELSRFGDQTVVALSLPLPAGPSPWQRLRSGRLRTESTFEPALPTSGFFGKEFVGVKPPGTILPDHTVGSVSVVRRGSEAFGLFRAMFLAKLARLAGEWIELLDPDATRIAARLAPDEVVSASFVPTPPFYPDIRGVVFPDSTDGLVEVDAVGFSAVDGRNGVEIQELLQLDHRRATEVRLDELHEVRASQNARLQMALLWLGQRLGEEGATTWNMGGDSVLVAAPDDRLVHVVVAELNASLGAVLGFRVKTFD